MAREDLSWRRGARLLRLRGWMVLPGMLRGSALSVVPARMLVVCDRVVPAKVRRVAGRAGVASPFLLVVVKEADGWTAAGPRFSPGRVTRGARKRIGGATAKAAVSSLRDVLVPGPESSTRSTVRLSIGRRLVVRVERIG